MNVLVSGVAGDIGFGAGRILRDWEWPGLLYGIDIHSDHAGLFYFDQCAVAPRASSSEYIEWISSYIKAHEIEIFLPTSEAEIHRFTHERINKVGDAKVLIANTLSVVKSLDKFECLSFLSEHGIAVPENGIVGANSPSSYPVIIKPRSGQGSKGIARIDSFGDFSKVSIVDTIWQDYLLPDDEEYTCPVYRSGSVGTRILVLKRKLQGGLTGSGEVIKNNEILKYVCAIAKTLELEGAMNVQLRLTASGPLLFEINPRLSSTLVFRDKLGFCDLRWWLSDNLGIPISAYEAPKAGTRFYRGAQEYIFFDNEKKGKKIIR